MIIVVVWVDGSLSYKLLTCGRGREAPFCLRFFLF